MNFSRSALEEVSYLGPTTTGERIASYPTVSSYEAYSTEC
jgi:hypothetical protein